MIIERFPFKYCLQHTINGRTDIRETVLFVPHTRNYTDGEKLSILSLILGCNKQNGILIYENFTDLHTSTNSIKHTRTTIHN